jgi:hypothetical protein
MKLYKGNFDWQPGIIQRKSPAAALVRMETILLYIAIEYSFISHYIFLLQLGSMKYSGFQIAFFIYGEF